VRSAKGESTLTKYGGICSDESEAQPVPAAIAPPKHPVGIAIRAQFSNNIRIIARMI
jgi:hypothetical protein